MSAHHKRDMLTFDVNNYDVEVFKKLPKNTLERLFSPKLLIKISTETSDKELCKAHYIELLVKFFNASTFISPQMAIKRAPLYRNYMKIYGPTLPQYADIIRHYQGISPINLGVENKCEICFLAPKKVSFVPCGHSACRPCVEMLQQTGNTEINSQKKRKVAKACAQLDLPANENFFNCPFCRELTISLIQNF